MQNLKLWIRRKCGEKICDFVLNNNFLDVTQKHESQNDKLIIGFLSILKTSVLQKILWKIKR